MNLNHHQAALFRFGVLMRAYRTNAGKTQTELAARLGVAVTRINALERGRVQGPGAALVDKLQPLLLLTQQQTDLMRAVAMRDRALLIAIRSGMDTSQIAFLAASLDAVVALGSQELDSLRQGLADQVLARQRTCRFLGRPTLEEDLAVN